MGEPKFFTRIKNKWGITSNLQAIIIFIVFGITGSASLWVGTPILNYLGVTKESMNPWMFWPLRILIIFPIYQVMLICIGTAFGQFKFFWEVEKKMFGRFIPRKSE